MKLIFLYGPPAAGKLTVAKELSKMTGYAIFHNHVTFDAANLVFEAGTAEHIRLSTKLRMAIFEAAAKAGVPGLIFTFCYAHPEDDAFVRRTMRVVERRGGTVLFVQLCPAAKTLERRVLGTSRKSSNKVKSIDKLRGMLERCDLFSPIPFVKGLHIDNTKVSAKDAARRIRERYGL